MGYVMFVIDARVRIEKRHFPQALAAIWALKGRETTGLVGFQHFMWINNSDDFLNAETLKDALKIWRWGYETDDQGNIDELEFLGEKLGNEDILFEAIAPYVSTGSEIRAASEEGIVWRWRFHEGQVVKENGRIIFE